MRLRIRHETRYVYETAAQRATEVVRLTPGGHDGQYVVNWRIDVSADCRLYASRDPFGNRMHNFTVEGPLDTLSIVAEGTVETTDTNGVLSGQAERFPPVLFQRGTPLTHADAGLRAFADSYKPGLKGDRIELMHRIMGDIAGSMEFAVDVSDSGTTAKAAFAEKRGVCQDFAHVFVAVCRHLGIPARFVSGYLYRKGADDAAAGHAWAEAHVDGLGWVGFDPANDMSPTDDYVRVATALDYLGASPLRGAHYGGDGESLDVEITVEKVLR